MDRIINLSIAEQPTNIDLGITEQPINVSLDIAVKGQKGDTGVIEISQDANNIITFGTDGKLYAKPHQFASTQW